MFVGSRVGAGGDIISGQGAVQLIPIDNRIKMGRVVISFFVYVFVFNKLPLNRVTDRER